jgi:hypothetical protein
MLELQKNFVETPLANRSTTTDAGYEMINAGKRTTATAKKRQRLQETGIPPAQS